MKVFQIRNVHEYFPIMLEYLLKEGIKRDSRNGPVLQAPCPVTTVYTHPRERVLFWPERDANPFFHLYESLWMLAGRNDLAPLTKYVKNIANYSDDGKTLHGAYGFRWRNIAHSKVGGPYKLDQLQIIAEQLREKPDDRRSVLQMWDAEWDLGGSGKDLPCNVVATFQRDPDGKLDLVVFCRSNDTVWGLTGANAVHFSILLEYMANWIGCPVGKYSQISVNYHVYLETLKPLMALPEADTYDPYQNVDSAFPIAVITPLPSHDEFHRKLDILFDCEENNFIHVHPFDDGFFRVAQALLRAHYVYKDLPAPQRFEQALWELRHDQNSDWIIAARQWIERRQLTWEKKQLTV